MSRPIPISHAMSFVAGVLGEAFSGRLWWRVARARAEARLAKLLECQGDVSMEVRKGTEYVRRMDFAYRFWRPAPGPVRQVVNTAETMGVPIKDLQLLVLNKDVRLRNGRVEVRRSPLVRGLTLASRIVIVAHWVLLSGMALTGPGALWLKAILVTAISAIYAGLYRGWALYTSRSIEAVNRSGDAIDELGKQLPVGRIVRTQTSPGK